MEQTTWTKKELALFRKLYPVTETRFLAKQLNRSYQSIKSKASSLKLLKKFDTCGPWTPKRVRLLKKLYINTTNEEIGKILGVTKSQVESKGFKLQLKKSKEFLLFHAMKTAFKQGHVPDNKGKKQTDYMTKKSIEKTKKTRFKKGQKSHTELFDGCITIRYGVEDKGSIPHKHIRLSKGKWQELQIYNWEKLNGQIPKGFVLACQDGNTLNCEVSNWKLLSKAQNAIRNSGHRDMPDTYVARLIAGRKNKDLKEDILKQPELIKLKRNFLILNRTINAKQKPVDQNT